MNQQLTIVDNHTWRLAGELSFATVSTLLVDIIQRIMQTPPQIIDLEEVTRFDSAGLALLIEIQKQMQPAPLTFRHIPAQMMTLATVCGVQKILTHDISITQ